MRPKSTPATTSDAAPTLTGTVGDPSDFAEEESRGHREPAGAASNASAPLGKQMALALNAPQNGR